MLTLPGLPFASRHDLQQLSDAALCDALVQWMLALRTVAATDGAAVARMAGLPEAEVVASPAAFRAVVLALRSGASTAHHEARAPIAWEAAQQGGEEVENQLNGVWDAGVLHIGKYQSFKQDEPFATYNPNHVAKWAPHELLHRACGFFWADGMSRFELYLTSRANETLPVALWYGWDECCRLRSDGFERANPAASREASLGDAVWLSCSEAELRDRVAATVHHFRWGLAHADAEFRLVREELAQRRTIEAAHPFLAPSSDARAYVVGHFARLTERSHSVLFGQLLVPGRDYFDEPAGYLDFLETVGDRLLCGPLELDPQGWAEQFQRRRVWDLASRAASLGWGRFRGLLPNFRTAFERRDPDLASLEAALEAVEPRLTAAGLPEQGYGETLLEGLESLSPPTAAWCRGEGVASLDHAWREGRFASRRPLVVRVEQWLREAAAPDAVRERFALESVIATLTRRDDDVEHLCDTVAASPQSRVVGSSAFRQLDLPWTLLLARAADDGAEIELPTMPPEAYGGLLVGSVRGEVAILPAPKVVSELWQASLQETVHAADAAARLDAWLHAYDDGSWPESGESWLEELAEAGLFGFLG